ncbi:hypothetical protein PRIPAC_89936 [Pristionchus pacificus]|uniref:Uncharacterized protein n=1 Tax=Pristionchus pacificus TaxID=54126 RepID=A0A2A6BZ39_PRIPA|nr:hypothetical protein PRIPAC_89936 [Pristionchus pacificus]|eukprot:PDM71129.1 hypothetical protein PRIPAC_43512 [Pristionchus pacificus]
MASAKKYDNASDEINYRILTLIQNAEKVYHSSVYKVIGRIEILCELPHNGDAVLVNQKDESQRTSRSISTLDEKSKQPKKNCCKCVRSFRLSYRTPSSLREARLPIVPLVSLRRRTTRLNRYTWHVTDNTRGVVVDVSVKVPHRSRPIQLSLDCPKDENARVLIGEKWLPLEERKK